ncbi:TIM-barrel domain-containing protein [Thiorhodovibrio winogradskyi]|nr:TIM-barrel domain-containing protein [Thiorhodovibrio winogradskyi]
MANAPAFSDIDQNGDGQIDKQEFQSAQMQQQRTMQLKMADHAESTPGFVQHWEAGSDSIIAEHAQALTRIDAVADDILRIRVAPAGRLAPSHSWQDEPRSLSGGRLLVEKRARVLHLVTRAMRTKLNLDTGAVSLGNADGAVYASDLTPVRWRQVEQHEIPTLAPALAAAVAPTATPAAAPTISSQTNNGWSPGPATTGLWLRKALHPREGLFGCGQRFGALNRRGQRLAHWTTDIHSPGLGVVDGCLYQAHPLLLALRPGLAWGLMLGSSGYSHFDLGAEQPDALGLFNLGGELDYTLFAGPTPAAVVEQITRLTGRPALPPLWALGYHQSRWGYRSDAEIRAIANAFRRRRIPIDAIHLDIDYMDGFRVFSWDRERFPSPRATIEALHRQDIHAVTIIDPGVIQEPEIDGANRSSDPVLESGLRGDHFIRRPDGKLFTGYVWSGASLFSDFCRTPTRRWWGEVLTRSASIGAQRWAVSWMGDNASSLEDLRTSLPQLASMGLGGSPHVGVDIGGFHGACDGELFARWIELGAFYPFMRAHAYHGSPPREPWAFGDKVEAIARTTIERRYQFLPYLYTLAHRAHRTGEPILRPLLYDFPRATELHGIEDQLMVGPRLMIAPVCEPGVSEREVHLPPGVWYDFHSGRRIDDGAPAARAADTGADANSDTAAEAHARAAVASVGAKARISASAINRRCLLPAPPGRMPILVRGGSCLTLGAPWQSTREPLTELILDAYPDDGQSGSWTLIEDVGDGWGYCDGELVETALGVDHERAGPRLMVGRRRGGWQPRPRQLVLRLHLVQQPDHLLLDGAPKADWHWDQADHAAVVSLIDDGEAHQLSAE